MNKNVRNRRKAFCFAITLIVSIYLMQGVSFAADSWTISQSVSQPMYEQGETFTLSVSLGGPENAISVSKIKAEVEYDMALFTITGVSATGMVLADSNYGEGAFTLAADTARTLNAGDLLFQVQMKVRENSSVGKTTICVYDVELESEMGNAHIVNKVPFSITVLQSADSGEDSPAEEFTKVERAKSNPKSHEASVTKKSTNAPAKKQLDQNYKTDAGFGNEWYFVIALGFGAAAFLFYLVYRKISSANNWES